MNFFSFFHFRARFFAWEGRGAAATGVFEMHHSIQQPLISPLHPRWLHTKTRPSKVGDLIAPTIPWSTSWPLFRGCSQQDLSHDRSIERVSGHSEGEWLDIQGFTNFTEAHIVAKCHIVNSSQLSRHCFMYWRWHSFSRYTTFVNILCNR